MVAVGPREVRHHLGRLRGVTGLRERGEGEWKRIVMVFVVGGNRGARFWRRNEKEVEGGDDDGDVGG